MMTDTTSAPDPLLTPSQAAEILGCASRTVLRWSDVGILTLAQRTPGGHRRFKRSDVVKLHDKLKASR